MQMNNRGKIVYTAVLALAVLLLAGCAKGSGAKEEEAYTSEYVSEPSTTGEETEIAAGKDYETPLEFSLVAEAYELYAEDWQTAYHYILDNLNDILYDPCGLRESGGGYPLDIIFLLLYDFNADGTPELVVGDWADVDVYTFRSGLCERVATIFFPVWSNDLGNFIEPVSGMCFYNDNLYMSNGGIGEGGGEYLMFGYFDGGWHIADAQEETLDGDSVSRGEIFELFPYDMYEGLRYIDFPVGGWLSKYSIVHKDGEMLLREISADDDGSYSPVDFDQFWEELYTEDWEKAYIELLYNRDEVLSNPDGARGEYWYPIDLLTLFLHDFDGDGIPELVVGDRYAVDVYTFRDGKCNRLASLYTPGESHLNAGIALCNNSLYLSDRGGIGERSYCVFGYIDGGYHTLSISEYMDGTWDGAPITYEKALQYIPHVLSDDKYVWSIEQENWIVEEFYIKNEDGNVLIRSEWEGKDSDYRIVDFDRLWE